MQFILDKEQKSTLFEQAREQMLTALHTGKLRAGDRLPSVRQIALRNRVNLKTAFSIYQRLKEEGYIEIRSGSGAYVSDTERADLDRAYCLAIFRAIKSNVSQAGRLKLDQQQYASLVQKFVSRQRFGSAQLTVIECNQEQINLFAWEIENQLNMRVCPLLLSKLEQPDPHSARLLARTDYFVTTDYHFKQVEAIVAGYERKVLALRLNAAFVPRLVATARRGNLLMVVSNTDFYAAFRHNLINIGIPASVLDNITAIDDTNLSRVHSAARRARSVYVSPICSQRVRKVIPARLEELKFDSVLSPESIEALEAVMLFHG